MTNIHIVSKESKQHKLGGWETTNRHQCDHSGFSQEFILPYKESLIECINDNPYEKSYFNHQGKSEEVVFIHTSTKIINSKFIKIWDKLVPDLTITTSNTWYKTDVNKYIKSNTQGVITMEIFNE